MPISPVDTSFQKDMCNRHFAAFLFAASCLFGQDLQSTEPKERIKAVRALRDSGSTAIATLTPLLSDPDRDVRLETVRSIVTIGTQHSLDPLVTATRDNDPEVQIRATDGLVNFYVPGYVRPALPGSAPQFAAASIARIGTSSIHGSPSGPK